MYFVFLPYFFLRLIWRALWLSSNIWAHLPQLRDTSSYHCHWEQNRSTLGPMANTRLGKKEEKNGSTSLKVILMHFVAPGLSIFHGQHQTVTKAFDNKQNKSRFIVTDKRKQGSSSTGWRRGRRCSRKAVTHPHAQQHQCMLFIGKIHVCYLRVFITAGAGFSTQ